MIDWDTVETVLLDLDGTLVDLHFDNYFWNEYLPRCFARRHGRCEVETRRQLLSRFDARQGTLQWYSVDYWSTELQLDVAALKHDVKHLIRLRPGAEELLSKLRAQGKRVHLVTNAHQHSVDIKMAELGLAHWFDAMVMSHDLGLPKEDPEFWRRLQHRHPFDPRTTLLIDDNQTVLGAARRHGIDRLLLVLQPDSHKPPRREARFPGILHFEEILPIAGPPT